VGSPRKKKKTHEEEGERVSWGFVFERLESGLIKGVFTAGKTKQKWNRKGNLWWTWVDKARWLQNPELEKIPGGSRYT